MNNMEPTETIKISGVKNSDFYQKHKIELEQLREFYRKTLSEDIMPFWEKRVLDKEMGGYFNCFDKSGKLERDVKCGWFVGRDIYSFSLLYNQFEKRPEWLKLSEEGVNFMMEKAYLKNGRFAQMMARNGEVINGAISIFTDHFAVKGLYEYITASEKKEYIPFAKELTDQLFANVKNPDILENEGIKKDVKKHAINFMTLLVAMESRKLFGDTYQNILEDCVEQSLYEFANDKYKAVFEYIKEDGTAFQEDEGRIIDPGHGMEAMWFCMKAGLECHRKDWVSRASEAVGWLIDRCYDEANGGFLQETDVDGFPKDSKKFTMYDDVKVPWDAKIWWVQAEALYALAMSSLLTENERHYEYFMKMHHYTETFFHDKAEGEWYSYLYRNNEVLCDKKGTVLKGPYHVPRCILQTYLLIDEYLK